MFYYIKNAVHSDSLKCVYA